MPPPPDEPGDRPGTPIPQRERVILLARLARLFVPVAGLVTAFTTVDGYPVLNVIPLEMTGRAATVGCRYRDRQWWFWYVRTDVPIRPVDELNLAARQIRADVERAAP